MVTFIEKWVQDTARDRKVQETGVIESEYPAHAGSGAQSGFCIPNSMSCSVLLSIPSLMWFKPRMLWIMNETAVMNTLYFYIRGSAADASATIGGILANPWDTIFVGLDCITIGKDLWAYAGNVGARIRVGGILVPSGPERPES